MRLRIFVMSLVVLLSCSIVLGQESTQQSSAQAQSSGDLRSAVQNPISSLISLPFKFTFDYGASNGEASFLNIQPVVPVTVGDWNLVSRLIVPQKSRFFQVIAQTHLSILMAITVKVITETVQTGAIFTSMHSQILSGINPQTSALRPYRHLKALNSSYQTSPVVLEDLRQLLKILVRYTPQMLFAHLK